MLARARAQRQSRPEVQVCALLTARALRPVAMADALLKGMISMLFICLRAGERKKNAGS